MSDRTDKIKEAIRVSENLAAFCDKKQDFLDMLHTAGLGTIQLAEELDALTLDRDTLKRQVGAVCNLYEQEIANDNWIIVFNEYTNGTEITYTATIFDDDEEVLYVHPHPTKREALIALAVALAEKLSTTEEKL